MEKGRTPAFRRSPFQASRASTWRPSTALFSVLFGAFLFATLFVQPAFGKNPTAPTCGDYYHLLKRRLTYDFNPLLKLRHAILRTGVADNIVEGEKLQGRFGGTRRVFTKKDPNQPWERYFDTPGFNDVLVNPDSILYILGSENAKKFGFELTPNKVVLPDASELRGAILNFNKQFPDGDARRLPINFFETSNLPLTGADYRKRFLQGGELPMAQSGRLHFHDFTAHIGAVFMPKEIVDETRRRIRIFSEFDNYLKSKDPGLRRLVSDLYQKRTDNLIDTHSNRAQNNLVEVTDKHQTLHLEMQKLSDHSYAIRPRDDIADALMEIVHYVRLRPEQNQALARHVQAYMTEQVAKDPTLADLPFGVVSTNATTAHDASGVPITVDTDATLELVRARSHQLMMDRLRELQTTFRDWTP